MSRVLVVDDFDTVRGFLSKTIQEKPGFLVVGECINGTEAVDKAVSLRPDLILLDIEMPKLDGLSAAREIRDRIPGSTIIFISVNRSWDVAQQALRTGARGYVVKSDLGSELWPAIDATLRGETYVSSGVPVLGHSVAASGTV